MDEKTKEELIRLLEKGEIENFYLTSINWVESEVRKKINAADKETEEDRKEAE